MWKMEDENKVSKVDMRRRRRRKKKKKKKKKKRGETARMEWSEHLRE